MNHFQAILPMVRRLLSEPELSPPRTLLDHLLEEQLLSREYHHTLLQELDTEALARKISLTLLGKGDLDLALLEWAWNEWQTPVEDSSPNDEDQTGELVSPGLQAQSQSSLAIAGSLGMTMWSPGGEHTRPGIGE